MEEKLKAWFKTWRKELSGHKYLILISLGFLIIANIINFLTSSYVDKISTTAVPDLILDHIPTLNLDFIFIYGLLAVILVIIFHVAIFHIKALHTAIFQFSLLILVRSFFMVLTHLGQPADARIITGLHPLFMLLTFRNDLFFSGHTAMPFMAFLLFRKEKIGIFFLIMTVILAATVLFMHVHYSIDVFSAFFITYGTYKFGSWLSKRTEKKAI
jgi:hypothetical protein